MFLYQIAVLTSFVISVVAAVAFLSFIAELKTARVFEPTATGLSRQIYQWVADNRDTKWIELQNYFKCCGYDKYEGDFANGAYCSKTPEEHVSEMTLCKDAMMGSISDKSLIIGSFAVAVAVVQMLGMLSSCCVIWRKSNPQSVSLASLRED